MPRDSRVYLDDILSSAAKIRSYVGSMDAGQFVQDGKTVDAVVRNLEIIGVTKIGALLARMGG